MGISRLTVKLLQRISPQKRLELAASLFWWTIFLGVLSVVFLCHDWFQRILMIISWLAVTITCVDIVCTSDVRANEETKNE